MTKWDGVVFHGIKSCRFVSSGMADTREYINKRLDVPTLYIESDLIDPRYWSDTQIKNCETTRSSRRCSSAAEPALRRSRPLQSED
ncbi:MAG: 2-hydroxyacyl-CoA dehydratase family protein [Rhodocyclaceae bacterium]